MQRGVDGAQQRPGRARRTRSSAITKGEVRLRPAAGDDSDADKLDPATQPPLILPNYLGDPYDVKMAVGGVKLTRLVARSGAYVLAATFRSRFWSRFELCCLHNSPLNSWFAHPLLEALRPFILEELSPTPELTTDDEIEGHVRAVGESIYHPVGTCKMGSDPADGAVTCPRLKVHGIAGCAGPNQ